MSRPQNVRGLPTDFARVLRRLYICADPQLGPTMKAANDKGWSYALLGDALELTGGRARQIALKESGHDPVPDVPEPVPGGTTDRPHLAPEQVARIRSLAALMNPLKEGIGHAERSRVEREFDDALVDRWIDGVTVRQLADDLGFVFDSVKVRVIQRGRGRSQDFNVQPTRVKLQRGRSVHAVGFAKRRADGSAYVVAECDKSGDAGEFLPDDSPVTCTPCQRAAEK